MTRTIFSKLALSALLIATAAVPSLTYAQTPPTAQPSAADMAAAKKAYAEGKKLHDAGKLAEAVEKFQKSYMLSKNPLLLYNVAVTMDEAGMQDLAIAYYKKFLTDAPAEAAQRPDAVAALAKLGGATTPTGTPPTGTPPTGTSPTGTTPPPETITIGPTKPAGTYSETDFQHEIVDTAPPGKPLDITAYVPPDSGWTVTLGFRTAGEGKFTTKTMKWRYRELVGRIPAPKMIGDAVQYYVEAKDGAGTVIARSGKATSPNLVTLEAGATPRFYPDITDDGDAKVSPADVKHHDDSDDPLHPKANAHDDEAPSGGGGMTGDPVTPGDGLMDVGSKKFKYARLGTTVVGAGLLAGSLVFYIQAGRSASALEDDSKICGVPPCRQFDSYDQGLQDAGKRDDKLSKVFLGTGVVVGAVAGYFWYKTLKSGHRHEARASGSAPPRPAGPGHDEDARLDKRAIEPMPWVVVPVLGEGFAGASAAVGF